MIAWDAKILPNFLLWEALCKCGCGLVILVSDLLDKLHAVREEYGLPIVATSWTRCWRWNAKVGGTTTSYHKNGRAIDIRPQDRNDIDVLEAIARKHFPFVKRYNKNGKSWLHCDLRGERPFVHRPNNT